MAGEFFYGAGNENTQCKHCSSLRYSVALAEKKCHYFDIFSLASPFEFASRFHKKNPQKGNFFMERATRIRNVNIARHNGI